MRAHTHPGVVQAAQESQWKTRLHAYISCYREQVAAKASSSLEWYRQGQSVNQSVAQQLESNTN